MSEDTTPKKQFLNVLITYLVIWVIIFIVYLTIGDSNLALMLNGKEDNFFTAFVSIYTKLIYLIVGWVAIYSLVAMLVPKLKDKRRIYLTSWFAYSITLPLVVSLKIIVNRDRPYVAMGSSINNFGHEEADKSFPSGHSSYSAAVLDTFALKATKYALSLLFIIIHVFMMYSRVYLGVHYVSDVLAGSVIGFVFSCISIFVMDKLYDSGKMNGKIEWIIFIYCLVVTISLLLI